MSQQLVEEIPVRFDDKGNTHFELQDADREALLNLQSHSGWKTYQRILVGVKNAKLLTHMQQVDPTVISKSLGEIVGLNLAINHLGATVASIRQGLKKKDESLGKNEKSGGESLG